MHFIKKHLLSNKQNGLIVVLTIFCSLLIGFRMIYSETIHFRFLLWNLFLALVPLVITYFSLVQSNVSKSRIRVVFILGVWLLFFPNAPYILTDLFHLNFNSSMPIWFDLVLIMSFAWTGLLAGFLSLMHIEQALISWVNKRWAMILVVVMLFMSSFGIYLGRFLRWNSWDILKHPGGLFNDVFDRFVNPSDHPTTWGVTIFLGLMLVVMYFSLKFFALEKLEVGQKNSAEADFVQKS